MIFIDSMEKICYEINLSPIYSNNKIKCGALKPRWYEKNNLTELLKDIYNATSFLDSYDPSLRERIYYIEHKYSSVKLCPYCNTRKLIFFSNKLSLSQRCSSLECKKILTSIKSKENEKKMDATTRQRKAYKISQALKGRVVFTEEMRDQCRRRNLGKKQSDITKRKRVETRKNNGTPWHTEDTKLKISNSNVATSKTEAHKEKLKTIFTDEYRKLHSDAMKRKILTGEFTPCITNSWTKWKSFVKCKTGEIKKFRSNWEAAFWLLNEYTEYENIRIPYIIDGENKIYIVDFSDKLNKILYEIKPNSTKNTKQNTVKYDAAINWCKENGWIFIIISDDWFRCNIHKINLKEHPQLEKSMKQFI